MLQRFHVEWLAVLPGTKAVARTYGDRQVFAGQVGAAVVTLSSMIGMFWWNSSLRLLASFGLVEALVLECYLFSEMAQSYVTVLVAEHPSQTRHTHVVSQPWAC